MYAPKMYAPKPAICGNGHAAMLRTYDVDMHLMVKDTKAQKKQSEKNREKNRKH